MSTINCFNVLKMIFDELDPSLKVETPITIEEINLKDQIKDILIACTQRSNYYIKEKNSLVFDKNEEEDEEIDYEELDDFESQSQEELDKPSQSSSYSPSPPQKRRRISFKQKEQVVEFIGSAKTKERRTFSSVQNRFRFVVNQKHLSNIQKDVKEGGNKIDKLERIAIFVLEEFKKARAQKLIVQDIDLKRWALKFNRQVNLEGFKASNYWIWKFKKLHRIVSRKITKFVTLSFYQEQENINLKVENFLKSTENYFNRKPLDNIFNSDQSGFNLEIHSGRSLEIKGTKQVFAVAQSLSSLTHSYTIQPTISASGELLSPMYVVLKETSGTFGPRVAESMKNPSNLFISASKSGKLTKSSLEEWFKNVYFPKVNNDSVLLLDSWTTYNDQQTINKCKPDDKNIEILRIPAKTTGLVQPLDVYFFRMWKNFARKFSDRVLLDGLDVNLHLRDNIIQLQSLIHNQFSSPRFRNFIKYAWFKSGYKVDRPPQFKTPVQICFNLTDETCQNDCSQCSDGVFIICSWCLCPFCFNHFFIENHICNNYVE